MAKTTRPRNTNEGPRQESPGDETRQDKKRPARTEHTRAAQVAKVRSTTSTEQSVKPKAARCTPPSKHLAKQAHSKATRPNNEATGPEPGDHIGPKWAHRHAKQRATSQRQGRAQASKTPNGTNNEPQERSTQATENATRQHRQMRNKLAR